MLKLKATVSPEQFPFIEEKIEIVNRKVVPVRGGSIVFSVTPLYVVAVKKVANTKSYWNNSNKLHDIATFEIKTTIEVVEL
jgi:hypothetical protein